uniref:Uncharacterized protein n=1 Tax=Phytophthora ramorum TaxID=164328 RepID=H3H651_PHYRM
MDTENEWVVYGIIYMAVMYAVFMFLSYLVLKSIRYEVLEKTIEDESNTAGNYVVETNTREKNVTPVTVASQDLWYSVPDPHNPKESLDLLKGINGFAVPGSITALMGSSGAASFTPIAKRYICSSKLSWMIVSAMPCRPNRSMHSCTESYVFASGMYACWRGNPRSARSFTLRWPKKTVPSPNLPVMVFANKRAATQMKSVVNRFFQMNWRTPIHNITLMILAIILVLLFSSVFIDTEYASFFGINSDLSVSLFLSMTGFQSVLSRTCSKRASFYLF